MAVVGEIIKKGNDMEKILIVIITFFLLNVLPNIQFSGNQSEETDSYATFTIVANIAPVQAATNNTHSKVIVEKQVENKPDSGWFWNWAKATLLGV